MEISKFNKFLSDNINRAISYEKQKDFQAAIKIWLKISEMTIRASKTPSLDFTYKNMLINKTRQIVEHIKSLKSKSFIKKLPQEDPYEEMILPEVPKDDELVSPDIEKINSSRKSDINKGSPTFDDLKIKDDSENKNIPKGFVEIEAPEDFNIITPHDPNYVQKQEDLSQKIDMNVFKPSNLKEITSDTKKGENLICFACGNEVAPNTNKCSNCGTIIN